MFDRELEALMLVPLLLGVVAIDFAVFEHLQEAVEAIGTAQQILNATFGCEAYLVDEASGNPYPGGLSGG